MSKIKEIASIFAKNPDGYHKLRFLVSEQIFILGFCFYFLAVLFTIGWFEFGPFDKNKLAVITYHLYSLLVVSTGFYAYSLVENFQAKFTPEKKFLSIIALFFIVIISGWILAVHLGLLS